MRGDLPYNILNVLSSYNVLLTLEYVHFANNMEVALSTYRLKKINEKISLVIRDRQL